MRIRFQTKITLCLLLTVGVLLGASLFLLDRAYSQQVQELIGTAQQQGRSNFNQSTERIRRGLLRDCMFLAQSSRLKAQFEEERLYAEAGGIALYEVEFHAVGCQFLSLTTGEGRPVARYLATPGWEPAVGEKPPLEPRPIDPKATYPEAEIVKRVLAGEDGTAQNPYIVDEGRLFQAMA
ncbi:MAG: hypothetical protein HYY93_04530, partial [Planctomycetes bacterium]|nr:hypothetical protein [Planctomycetota bacterium]